MVADYLSYDSSLSFLHLPQIQFKAIYKLIENRTITFGT